MKKSSICLFGGALLSAGLINPAAADITTDGALVQTQFIYGNDFGSSVFAYSYGMQTIDTFDFTVLADGQVIIDMLSWDIQPTWIDSIIFLFNNDGNPPTALNHIATNDDGPELGLDLNGSLSPSDSFIDIFLTAGEYTIATGAFLTTIDDVASGQGLGLVWDGGGNGLPTIGQYHIDIIGNVSIPSACPADMNNDGLLNFFDVSAFLNAFAANDSAADFNADGLFNFFDVSAFLNAFGAGCP